MTATRHATFTLAAFGTIGLASARALAGQTLKVSAQPTVVIGADGDTTAQFTAIGGLARLSTGEVAVFTAPPFEIRLFSRDGKFVRRVARPGSGPGELGIVYWFGRSGDSLMTFDDTQARITIFDVPRSQVATIPFAPTKVSSRMVVNGSLANGSWIVATMAFPRMRPEGPSRDTTTIGLWRSGVEGAQTVGSFPNFALFSNNGPAGTSFEFDALAANTTFLTVGNEIWVGIPEARSITVYDSTGKLVPYESSGRAFLGLRCRLRSGRPQGRERRGDGGAVYAHSMTDG